jgi:signal transduction histidine kinase
MADEGIYSIFNNLISNAIRHGNAGKIIINIKNGSSRVIVSFRDDGRGIPIEVVNSIFREGVTYGRAKGSGLGLFIVRRSLYRIGGTIKLDPGVQSGAGFILTFVAGK